MNTRTENLGLDPHFNIFYGYSSHSVGIGGNQSSTSRGTAHVGERQRPELDQQLENNLTRALLITLADLANRDCLTTFLDELTKEPSNPLANPEVQGRLQSFIRSLEAGNNVSFGLLRWPWPEPLDPADSRSRLLLAIAGGPQGDQWTIGSRPSQGKTWPDAYLVTGDKKNSLIIETKCEGERLDILQTLRQLNWLGLLRPDEAENLEEYDRLTSRSGTGDLDGARRKELEKQFWEPVRERQPAADEWPGKVLVVRWKQITEALSRIRCKLGSDSFVLDQCLEYYGLIGIGHFQGLAYCLRIARAVRTYVADLKNRNSCDAQTLNRDPQFADWRTSVRRNLGLLVARLPDAWRPVTPGSGQNLPSADETALNPLAWVKTSRLDPGDISIRWKRIPTDQAAIQVTPVLWMDLTGSLAQGESAPPLLGFSLYSEASSTDLSGVLRKAGQETWDLDSTRWEDRLRKFEEKRTVWLDSIRFLIDRWSRQSQRKCWRLRIHFYQLQILKPSWQGGGRATECHFALNLWETSSIEPILDRLNSEFWSFPELPNLAVVSADGYRAMLSRMVKPAFSLSLCLADAEKDLCADDPHKEINGIVGKLKLLHEIAGVCGH